MSNDLSRLRALIHQDALQVGDVTDSADGMCTVELPGGGVIRARGVATIGSRVFVRGGLVEGAAPSLPLIVLEV